MVKTKQTYGCQTIGSLMQALKTALQENKYLTLDSPVFISDYNMSQQNYEFDILPAFSSMQHTAGLCLFHSLNSNKDYEEEIELEPTIEEHVEDDKQIMKFVKWFKE